MKEYQGYKYKDFKNDKDLSTNVSNYCLTQDDYLAEEQDKDTFSIFFKDVLIDDDLASIIIEYWIDVDQWKFNYIYEYDTVPFEPTREFRIYCQKIYQKYKGSF